MLVAPLYARHKGVSRQSDNDQWSIPWILRFCYLIRALKYIFPICLAVIGLIDFFVTWKYCSLLPLFWAPVFSSEIRACLLVFFLYVILYFIIVALDIAPALISSEDPKIKCLLYLMICSVVFCVSPFLLYAIFAIIFSFQTWTIESAEYKYIKWIHLNIVQYLQNDINAISKKYFRIARDRPLRIYIIMFKALIMWLNIQLFQFLITDYARYCDEWQHVLQNMEQNSSNCCGDEEEKYDGDDVDSNRIGDYYHQNPSAAALLSKSSSFPSESTSSASGCCDFNFNKNSGVAYDSLRLDRYNKWCNERYFQCLRSPLAIIHEIVESYPETQIDYVNVYNLSQRHLYRYSNDIFDAALANKHPMYAYAAIALYLWSIIHTVLFFICYHFGFKSSSEDILGFIYLIEYVALFAIYTMIIFNVLHCDRLLTIIQNTSWFDDRLRSTIRFSLIGDANHNVNEDDGALILQRLSSFYTHHKRVVQITIQHYMMLHVLNLILENRWLSKLIIEYLYGFHAFHEGDDNLIKLIKNIIHGNNRNEWRYERYEVAINDAADEWSLSLSQSQSIDIDCNKNLDINNLDNLPIPTDSNLIGISRRIINTPDIDTEVNVVNGGDLLNTFMEYREYRNADRKSINCGGFIRMWDELNLDAVRLQYDAFKKAKHSLTTQEKEIQHQHSKTLKSLQFYFDFIRSLHYSTNDDLHQT